MLVSLSENHCFYLHLEDKLDDGQINFIVVNGNWDGGVGPGFYEQTEVPDVLVGTPYESRDISGVCFLSVDYTPDIIIEKYLKFDYLFDTLLHFERKLLCLPPYTEYPDTSGILLLNIDLCLGHIESYNFLSDDVLGK